MIRKNVAANPNTPKEVLWKLGQAFPKEVLENPVFPLLLLENPNLIEEIPQKTIISFFQCSSVPISFMEWVVKTDWIYESYLSLGMNSQTPRTILKELLQSSQKIVSTKPKNYFLVYVVSDFDKKTVAEVVELHVNYVGELKEDWWQECYRQIVERIRASDIDLYFFPIIVAMGLIPESVLELLITNEEINIRILLASSPISQKLLEKLAKLPTPLVRAGVAKNRNAPAKLLEFLAKAPTPGIQRAIAENPNTPAHVLQQFADDEYLYLIAASNPNTPQEVLERLAQSQLEENLKLKKILAFHPNTPVDILEKLQNDSDEGVRDRLAGNPSTPKYILEKFAYSKRKERREALARNPKLSEPLIFLLAEDESSVVRRALATNPRTVLPVLLRLWEDRDSGVRRMVVTNPKAPFYILEQGISELLQYKNMEVKHLVLRYLKEKPEGLSMLLEIIVQEIKKPFEPSRTVALWHPQMPPKVLTENARSLNWLERCAIAQNPNTPTETLQLLATDGNRIVRAAAKENLERRLNT